MTISSQPPLSMSPPSQTQGTSHSTSNSLLAGPVRSYQQESLHGGRLPFSSISHVHNPMSRPSFSAPRSAENSINSLISPNTTYAHQPLNNPIMPEPSSRTDPSLAGAPPFADTRVLQHVYYQTGQQILPDIQAKIHKGFFQVDNKWTCYRRNYFSVTCSFSLRGFQPNNRLYLKRNSPGLECINSFLVAISAVVGGELGDIRHLVQHTPKRSKDTEAIIVYHVEGDPDP